MFRFVLTAEEGVTKELHSRIVDARMGGGSLTRLRKELTRNRYTRLYDTMIAYYDHVTMYSKKQAKSTYGGTGSSVTADIKPDELHNPASYYDYEAPSVAYMSNIRQRHAVEQMPLWINYTQRLHSPRLCIDATFKVVKKIKDTNVKLLFSVLDVDTGCIIAQQFLTHETRDDTLPIFEGIAERYKELNQPLPTRVCSDRGHKDTNLIHAAFPDSHVNVDPWHFQQLFADTLDKNSSVWADVAKSFSEAVYKDVPDADGKMVRTHDEPDSIIGKVDALIKTHSHADSNGVAACTKKTKTWWNMQKGLLQLQRICSHPAGEEALFKMSSSQLENYHRQLNRIVRSMVKCSEGSMHLLLLQFMFHWNVDRRRQKAGETDWHTYDLQLVDAAHQACVRARGRSATNLLWPKHNVKLNEPLQLPRPLATVEHFGLDHPHVTLTHRMTAAQTDLTISQGQLELIMSKYSKYCERPAPANNTRLPFQPITLTPNAAIPPPLTSTLGLLPTSPLRLPPHTKLSNEERKLLSWLRKYDPSMKRCVEQMNWDLAAARWNVIDEQSNGQFAGTKMHPVHGDMVKCAVAVLDGQSKRAFNKDWIEKQAEAASRDIDAVISYLPVSPHLYAFTPFEDMKLQQIVKASSASRKTVDWKSAAKRWREVYNCQVEANSDLKVRPRDGEMLRSRWGVIRKYVAAAAAAEEETTATGTTADGSAGDAVDQTDVHSAWDGDASDVGSISDLGADADMGKEERQPWRPGLLARGLTFLGLPPTFTAMSTGASSSLSSSSSSSSSASPVPSASASSTANAPSSAAPSSAVLPAASVSAPASAKGASPRVAPAERWHWGEPATNAFIALGTPSGFQWTYDEFKGQWDAKQFFEVDQTRWQNKNRTEKLFATTGSRVKSASKRKVAGQGESSRSRKKAAKEKETAVLSVSFSA